MEASRALLAAAVLTLAAAAGAEGLYLHVVPAERSDGADLAAAAPLHALAYVRDPQALAAGFASGVADVADDHVSVALNPYPQLEPLAPERFLAASFVIDFEEPALAPLRGRLVGEPPTIDALRGLTAEAIPNKSLARSWDLASQVAASGSGDCTEHAVLLTALARASGRPARVVLGMLLVQVDGELLALGHAWSELHEDGRWIPVDATPAPEEPVEALAYLPSGVLLEEGPGYSMPLMRMMQHTWVQRVVVE